jgi:NAD(P)-dependent dehydrogenase (short-subunit alcohol dehydrogenase family)
MFDLTGKTALVTGAASGIGLAIAKTLADANAFVFIVDRNKDAEFAAVATISKRGAAAFLCADVADETSCRTTVSEIAKQGYQLDILVNNAGIGHVGTILQTSGDDLDRLYSVNVRGAFNMTKAVIGKMLEQQSGSIINMASIAGMLGVVDRVAYCATKFAVVGLTKSMALDHASQGVRVNCICPARVNTPFVEARLREYPDPDRAFKEMSQSQPIGRMATASEIAAAALYLASDESAFVTGSCFVIDGGFSAGK